jgi:hypothetical protein
MPTDLPPKLAATLFDKWPIKSHTLPACHWQPCGPYSALHALDTPVGSDWNHFENIDEARNGGCL